MSPASFQNVSEIPSQVLATLARRFLIEPLSPARGPRLDGLTEAETSALDLLRRTLKISDVTLLTTPEAQNRLLEEISRLLRVHSAWRLSLDLVLPSDDPLTMVKTFVERFGVNINPPGHPTTRFLFEQTIPIEGLDLSARWESGALSTFVENPKKTPIVEM